MTILVSFVITEEIFPYISQLLPLIESAQDMFQARYTEKDSKEVACRVSEGYLDEAYVRAFASVEDLLALAKEKGVELPAELAAFIIQGTTIVEGRADSYISEKGYIPWSDTSV